MPNSISDQFTVVLVQPEDNANIGAVARAMKNTGFSKLTLVSASRYEIDRAAITACWARDILEGAKMTDNVETTVGDCEDVIGFSAREGKNRPLITLKQWLEEIQTAPRRTAILFGPEETGLYTDHISYCRRLVRIPSRAECPSYNLAQAVLIVLYEVSKLSWQDARPETESRVPWDEYHHLDSLVNEALSACGFYNEGTPPHMPHLISNLFKRILPDDREMKILQGIFGRIIKALATRHSK